jgi:predicted Rossmann fold nucleotide-binding protein DprA/Smf involved in DNA uptake
LKSRFLDEERIYWLGFNAFTGIGPKRFALIKNYLGSAKKAWEASEREWLAIGLSRKLVDDFLKFRKTFNLSSAFLRLRENKIEAEILDDKDYPENLKRTDNPPFVLYVKG